MKMSIPRVVSTALTVLCVMSVSSSAAAQVLNLDDTGTEGLLTTSSTSTTTGALTTAGVVVTIVAITPKPESNRALRAYLEANPADVRQSIALGAGDAATDLSLFFAVPPEHAHAFANILRDRHATLLSLMVDDQISEEETWRFIQTIHGAMLVDDALSSTAHALGS